ncbi:hypothetical protein [Cardinium endosymbiont of Nabis limbatus]|uniref:hypothetical protein n=1 Tax=Cardinium endosymbiont of Nabis limbatus TaxID=3066217 RepID=UPI003AF3D37A
MKKSLVAFTFIGLFTHNILAKQSSLASDIQECCVTHLNSGSIYCYMATPNKVLAQGAPGCTKCKNKHLMVAQYQVQTSEITRTMTVASIMLLQEQKEIKFT